MQATCFPKKSPKNHQKVKKKEKKTGLDF